MTGHNPAPQQPVDENRLRFQAEASYPTTISNVFHDFSSGGYHRLRNKETGQRTVWAGYRQACLLDDLVGYTAFHAEKEGTCSRAQFADMVCVSGLEDE